MAHTSTMLTVLNDFIAQQAIFRAEVFAVLLKHREKQRSLQVQLWLLLFGLFCNIAIFIGIIGLWLIK